MRLSLLTLVASGVNAQTPPPEPSISVGYVLYKFASGPDLGYVLYKYDRSGPDLSYSPDPLVAGVIDVPATSAANATDAGFYGSYTAHTPDATWGSAVVVVYEIEYEGVEGARWSGNAGAGNGTWETAGFVPTGTTGRIRKLSVGLNQQKWNGISYQWEVIATDSVTLFYY